MPSFCALLGADCSSCCMLCRLQQHMQRQLSYTLTGVLGILPSVRPSRFAAKPSRHLGRLRTGTLSGPRCSKPSRAAP